MRSLAALRRLPIIALAALIALPPQGFAADFAPPSGPALRDGAGAPLAEPAAPPDGETDLSAEIEAAFARADALPAERFEVAALAARLGSDPMAAFAFVRDSIRLDLYPGVLRGADGALAAGAANDADRALLLKALLDAMGVPARFASAPLDEAAAARLQAALFAPRAGAPAPDAAAAFAPAFLDRIRARAGRDAAILATALGSSTVATMEGAASAPPAATGDHVWVQAEIGGVWTDLDTALPDAAPGVALMPAAATADTLDAGLAQSVTLTVSATVGGAEQVLLTQRLDAAAAAAAQILLYFEPAEGGLGGSIAGGGGYRPVLLVGGERFDGEPIAGTEGGGGVAGAIGMLEGGGEETPLTQLTLDIAAEAPGFEPLTARRVLAAAPPGGTLPADAEGLIPMRWLHHVMISTGGQSPREFAIVRAAAMDFAVREIGGGEETPDLPLPALAWPATSADLALTTASERLFVEALNRPGLRAYVGRPRVFVVSSGPLGGEGGTEQGFALDLALDHVTVAAESGAGGAAERFWYGVEQAALETEYGLLRLAAMDPSGRSAAGASLALGGGAPTVIGPETQLFEAPAALKAALGTGALVVLAGDPASARVWWTVAPDGATRAVLDPSLGGLTGGGPYHSGGPYVNSSGGGPRYIIDNAGRTVGEVRNGRDMMYRNAARSGSSCKGGSEYMTVLGCVSVPTSLVLGVLGLVIVATYGYVAVTIIRAL
ncbi:MAG: transglutaminase domain-containing protein [Alphaproteobacteria bacterium]